jgi:cytoskeletal protein CcmA (bactofilin family)
MNKCLLLTLQCLLLFSIVAYGQKSGKNPNSNGNEDGGRVNLLLPHGNVGINTLSPSERLEVIGNARISNRLFVHEIDVVGLSATSISVKEDINVGRNVLVNGNVGIGILSPSERLEISGNLRVSSTIFTDRMETNSFLGDNGVFNSNLKIGELFTVDGLTGLGVAAPVERLEVAGNIKASENLISSGIQTGTGAFSSSVDVTENLKVNGNTGLGVISPTERLEVAGNVRVSNGIFTETLEGNSFIMNAGTVNNEITVGGNAVVNGNVGIGITTPGEKLEVSGNVKASGDFTGRNLQVEEGSFSTNVNIAQNLTVAGTSDFSGKVTGKNLAISSHLQTNSLAATNTTVGEMLSVGGNTLISGNTGLGVAAPAERLEVEGNVKVSNTIYTTSLESVQLSMENGNISNNLTVGGNAAVGGNFGVGVTAPTEKFEVAGNIKASGDLIGNTLQAGQGNFQAGLQVKEDLSVKGVSDFSGKVTTRDLTVLNTLDLKNGLSLGGSLGIGIAVPQATLHVAGDGNFEGNVTAVKLIVQDLEVKNLDLGAQEGGQMSFDKDLLVKGSLGIGTEKVSGYTLSVKGKIRSSDDIRVYPDTEWADYVFEEDYSLPTINEVASYISENKHLPEMPSAAEVEKEGIQLGEMDAKLLRKIEELTLYIIQLENKNSKMETENQGLIEEMKQLKADVLLIKQAMAEKDRK